MILKPGDIFNECTNNRVNTQNLIYQNWITLSGIRHVLPIMTEDLYNAYIDDEIGTYEDLDIYVKPCWSYFTLLDNFDMLYIRITDNGVYTIGQTQNGNVKATPEEKDQVKSSLKLDGRKWGELLTTYLNSNYSENTLYDSSESIYNNITVVGGLVFPKT